MCTNKVEEHSVKLLREQYANDVIISDWVLAQGYAFASTDKGNSGNSFFTVLSKTARKR